MRFLVDAHTAHIGENACRQRVRGGTMSLTWDLAKRKIIGFGLMPNKPN